MKIIATRLSSGYVHVRGEGPCNWAQPPRWPCDEDTLRKHAFPEASETFIRAALSVTRVELPPVRVQGFDRLFKRLGEVLKGSPDGPV